MKKKSVFSDISFWTDLCLIYAFSAIALYLEMPWQTPAVFAILFFLIAVLKIWKKGKESDEVRKLERRFQRIMKKAKKQGNMAIAYKALDEEVLPALRKELPSKIYKYYSLGENASDNQKRLDTLKENSIWASVPSMFNDPFECRFMYLNDEDLASLGFPSGTIKLWDLIMGQLRQHITTICFSQNPNDMPMWAYYANEHRGFCVEYEIVDARHLYPVLYAENRLNTQGLFVELIYGLFCKEATAQDKATLFKHIMLLCSFKDKSWKAEKEIRAIFLNTKDEIPHKGRRCPCEEIGIKPTKIFIGVQCSEEHTQSLITNAKELGIDYEICQLSTGENASVIKEVKNKNN